MMRPFWDGGYKTLPRNRQKRVDYLIEWVQSKKSRGLPVDQAYYNYIQRWSVPDKRERKSI